MMQLQATIPEAAGNTSVRLTAAVAVACLSTACVLDYAYDPTKATFLPVCPVYALTGCACPGCGLTRGFHALFNGNISGAIGFNALLPVWVVILGYAWLSLLLYAIRGKGLPMWATNPRFLWVFMIVLLVFGVIRNIPAYPFTLLFP